MLKTNFTQTRVNSIFVEDYFQRGINTHLGADEKKINMDKFLDLKKKENI